ncbi:MAG: hypothetical protein JRE57_17430 [Deltaproteobacteria bacterium]|nr:hypothetical protein [Deltaproteobacteria bacterium]
MRQTQIHHGSDATADNLRVTERVRITAQVRDLAHHPLERGHLAPLSETKRIAVRNDCTPEVRLFGHPGRHAVATAAASLPTDVALVESGKVDEPHHGFAVHRERDQRREERDST